MTCTALDLELYFLLISTMLALQDFSTCDKTSMQPCPQGLLLDDFQNGGSSGEDPGKGWVTWYEISKNLGDLYHVTF